MISKNISFTTASPIRQTSDFFCKKRKENYDTQNVKSKYCKVFY